MTGHKPAPRAPRAALFVLGCAALVAALVTFSGWDPLPAAAASDSPDKAMHGVWSLELSAEQQAEMSDEEKAELSKMSLNVMDGLMTAFDEIMEWELDDIAGDILLIEKVDERGREKTFYVRVVGDTMTWAREGDPEMLTWKRRVGAQPDIGPEAQAALGVLQLRAKRSEAPSNADALRTAEKAYHAEWDSFTSVATCPPGEVGPDPVAWDSKWPCTWGMENLGWVPDGKARCRYTVEATNSGSYSTDDFTVTAECDIDGDGVHSIYRANRAEKASMVTSNDVY